MKHVSILVPKGHFSLVNVEGAYQLFSWVNEHRQRTGNDPLFRIQLVGSSKVVTQTNRLFSIRPEVLVQEVHKTDLIVIPALHGDLKKNLKLNGSLLNWITDQYKKGAEVACFCVGSFFLAATGLLDGKPCATHWQFAHEFRKSFPAVKLMDDKIITEADGIYTSGGAFSFTNLIIYLIEKYAGHETAILASKTFMIDMEKTSQSPFIMFTGQKTHKDETVLHAQEYIEHNFQDRITVEELSENFGVGRRTFERRFKKATSNTVVEYIQRVKIEAAKKHLEAGRKNVNEVMYDVGYTDTKAFRDVFKKVTGMSPIDYRNKYNKIAAVNN